MRNWAVFELWGSGGGMSTHLSPCTRLWCGMLIFFIPLASDPTRFPSLALSVFSTMAWIHITGIPLRNMATVLLICGCMFLPFFLLTPWIKASTDLVPATQHSDIWNRLQVPYWIAFKGTSCTLIANATIASVQRHEFDNFLGNLPVPKLLKILITQIFFQAGSLFAQTRGIVETMTLRGATNSWKASLLLIRSLPTTWLPRLANRAVHLANAMEIRGFDGQPICFEQPKFSVADILSIIAVCVLVSAAVILRWRWW